MGALSAIREAGLSVPDDVSVVRYGNTYFAQLSSSSLSSVDQQRRKMGMLAVRLLLVQIQRWLVEAGAEVKKGGPVLEIETDKTSFEIEANADGIIRGLRGEEGETAPVGATLAYIATRGEEFVEPEAETAASAGNSGASEERALTGGGVTPPATESRPEAPQHRDGRGV
jgi:pyruvate/2-oxoglutarate dehydrogenase complex dihydrolipoamide acyltransferase (E2) component